VTEGSRASVQTLNTKFMKKHWSSQSLKRINDNPPCVINCIVHAQTDDVEVVFTEAVIHTN
jgi:hypothetical protein